MAVSFLSTIGGDMSEHGDGSALVAFDSLLGDLYERGDGSAIVAAVAVVEGDVCERGPGTIVIDGGIVEGNVGC